MQLKKERRLRRQKRVRAKIFGTNEMPRLSVFRSIKHIYCQLINDEKGATLASAGSREIKVKTKTEKGKTGAKNPKTEGKKVLKSKKLLSAYEVGKLIAEKAKKIKIEKVIFDRGKYRYHGRIKALAEGAREGGLKF